MNLAVCVMWVYLIFWLGELGTGLKAQGEMKSAFFSTNLLHAFAGMNVCII